MRIASASRLRAITVTGILLTATLASAGSASANDPTFDVGSNGADTLQNMARCADHTEEFRFRFYYSAGYTGAWVNVGHNIYDLKAIAMGGSGGGYHPLRFCDKGNGAGQNVANNSASAYNWYSGYCGTVHYSAGYKGASEKIWWGSGQNLTSTKNNNRSISFSQCW